MRKLLFPYQVLHHQVMSLILKLKLMKDTVCPAKLSENQDVCIVYIAMFAYIKWIITVLGLENALEETI